MSEKPTIGLDYSHQNKLTLEASSYSDFTNFLFSSGYKLGKIQAGFDSLQKLESYSMILISTPNNTSLTEEEIDILEEYVKNGGGLLIVSSSGGDYSNKANLNDLTKRFGFEFENDEVNDSMNYVNLQKRPLLTKFKAHTVTEQIKKIVFSSACSLKVLDFLEDEENIIIEVLSTSGINSWRKLYDGKDWTEEDSPKVPLMAAIEYYKGKVVGFGNLSLFSSLGREYGFSAFDNDILIANIMRWLTIGITMGKVVTVNLNLDLFYWAQSIIEDQDWESVSDIINLSLKYFKDHYKDAIEEIEKLHLEKIARRKAYEKGQKEALVESAEDKILEMVPVRKKDDLLDIMSAIEDVTGEKYELSIDLEEEFEDFEAQLERGFEKEKMELEEELKVEMDKEQELIIEKAKEEIEKEIEQKIEEEKITVIETELEYRLGAEIKKVKDKMMEDVIAQIDKEREKILEETKEKIDDMGEDADKEEISEIMEQAKEEIEKERKRIMDVAKEKMETDREKRIDIMKSRQIEIIKENEEFFEDILDATDLFAAPILDKESSDFTEEDVEEFEKDTSKHAFWHGKPTKAFKEWVKEKEK